MKIVLDNCVHYRAKELFSGHFVSHACDLGWGDLSNGLLLKTASAQFDLLVTTDKNLRYEQNLELLPIAVLEMNTRFTRIADLLTVKPHLDAALTASISNRFVSVSPDGTIVALAPR